MNKRIIKEVFFIIILLAVFVYLHEATHYAINLNFGCDKLEFDFDGLGIVSTIDPSSCINDDVLLAHSINEIVGYNIMPFLLLIIIIISYQRD